MWRTVTNQPASKHGGLLILHLDDATQDEVLEQIDASEVKKKKGVNKVLNILDKMCKKDESISDYGIYVNFESYTRPVGQSVSNHCDEFDRKYRKVKNTGTYLSDHILALKLLQSSKLSDSDERVIKACISEITYEAMKMQLKKTYIGELPNSSHCNAEGKQEEINIFYRPSGNSRKWKKEMCYPPSPSNQKDNEKSPQVKSETNKSRKMWKHKNSVNVNGFIPRCKICESINHIETECPDQQGYFAQSSKGLKANSCRNLEDDNITYEVSYLERVSSEQNCSRNNANALCSPEKKHSVNSVSVDNKLSKIGYLSNKPDVKYNRLYNRKYSYFRQGYHIPKCYNCHVLGHISVNCPEEYNGRKCFICKETGHMAKDCEHRYFKRTIKGDKSKVNSQCNPSDSVENTLYYSAMCYICGENNHTAIDCTKYLDHKKSSLCAKTHSMLPQK